MAEVAVVVLFGLPASGKSTLSRSVKDRFLRCRHDIATMYIEFDHFENKHRAGHDLLNLLKDETYDFASWKEGRKTALLELSAVLNRPSERKQIIVIDDTLHLRSMRKEIYRISSQYSTTQTHFIFVDAPVEVCVSRNLERQEGKPKKHSLSGHEEIHGSKQGSRDVVVAGPLAIPTDELIQNHSHVLNQECDAWRVKGQSSSPLHLVPIQFRYKWERAQNCFCWHLDAATVSAEDLAELLVEQFSRLVDEKRVSDVLPDTKPTSASCSGTSELDSHINVLDQQLRNHLHVVISQSSVKETPETIRDWNRTRVALIREFRGLAHECEPNEWTRVQNDSLQKFRDYIAQQLPK